MNGTKQSAEAVNKSNMLLKVGERSALGRSSSVSKSGRRGSENVGLSSMGHVKSRVKEGGEQLAPASCTSDACHADAI